MSALTTPILAHIRSELITAVTLESDEIGLATPEGFDGGRFVRLNQLGGRPTTFSNATQVHLHTIDVSVQCYEASEVEALELAGVTADAMCALASSASITVSRSRLLSGLTILPDDSRPLAPYPRVVSTFAVTYHPI